MPLVQANFKKSWQLPDDPRWPIGAGTPFQRAAFGMCQELSRLVAQAVNVIDNLPEGRWLTDNQVVVNPGMLHSHALNASEAQILINPGGGPRYWLFRERRQRRRRARIHDFVRDGLVRLEAGDTDWTFPDYDIEIIPSRMTGSTTRGNRTIGEPWGGAHSIVQASPMPTHC
ncbi:MAG TPA: hypothetical protein VGH44_00100 [Candidatus Saccharimonadia bacterium]|jgi:hypothetical protein